MLNLSTHSGKPLPSKSNGADETPVNRSNKKYYLEDFSQQAINRGQVEINFLLTVVNEKISAALKEFEAAAHKLANDEKVDFRALKEAIDAVHEANQKVAGPFPPGCDTHKVTSP